MGVQFVSCIINATVVNNITINVAVASILKPSIIGITKFTDEGASNKVQTPYVGPAGYKTVWEPMGQKGWNVNIQGTLRSISGASGDTDEIICWQKIDTGTLLKVLSNTYTRQGHDPSETAIAYDRLPVGSLWYVDQLIISSIPGVMDMAQCQISLIRCWGV